MHRSPWAASQSLSCHATKWFGIKPLPCQSEPCERELSVTALFEEWGGGGGGMGGVRPVGPENRLLRDAILHSIPIGQGAIIAPLWTGAFQFHCPGDMGQ